MNKKEYIKASINIIKMYDLTREEKGRLIEQMMDVVNEIDVEDIMSLGEPDQLVEEILELNDLKVKKIKKGHKHHGIDNYENYYYVPGRGHRLNKVIFGLAIILFGLSFIFESITFGLIFGFLFLGWGLTALIRRNYFLTVIFALIGLSILNSSYSFINLNFPLIFLALIFILIGFNIMFGSRKRFRRVKRQYYYHDQKETEDIKTEDIKDEKKENIEQDLNNIRRKEKYEKEVFVINNKLAGSENKFIDEKTNYITVNNVLGGTDLDFSEYTFPLGDITIDVRNVLGGCAITIANNVEIIVSSKNILGGIETPEKVDGIVKNQIYVIGENILGGTSIRRI